MSDENSQPKERRSPRIPGEGRRPTVTFRCRTQLKEKVEARAQEADRSISEEIERRLEGAYHQEENQAEIVSNLASMTADRIFKVMYEDVGGRDNFQSGIHFANALKSYQKEADAKFRSEAPWFKDHDKKKHVLEGLRSILPFVLDMLVNRLDPEAEELARKGMVITPLSRLGLGLHALGPLGSPVDQKTDFSSWPHTSAEEEKKIEE